MPLKRILDEIGTFDPNAVTILVEAFERVVAEFGLQAPEERERAARLIIRLADGQPDLDAATLRDAAAALMKN